MKKIILILISFFALNAAAQITVKPGVRAGLNLSTITNTELDTKADFYVGGFVAIKFAKFYTLQPEINYSRQGAKGHFEEVDFDPVAQPSRQDVDYSLQYVSLTVMNKFTFAESFSVMAGPSLDFKVSDNFTSYAKDELVGFDLGLNAGIGYTLPVGLTIEARYKLGLVDIFGDNYRYNDNDYYNDDIDNIKLNSVVQLGLAYTF